MEHPFLDFLGPALVPELSSDVAAGSPGHIQLVLVPVAALGAFPHQLAALIRHDLNLAVKSALLAEIALGI